MKPSEAEQMGQISRVREEGLLDRLDIRGRCSDGRRGKEAWVLEGGSTLFLIYRDAGRIM